MDYTEKVCAQADQPHERKVTVMEEMRKIKVLVVDDDTSSRFILTRILNKTDYEISEASCGQVAIEMAIREQPHLIIMDNNLPDLTGYEVSRQLKENSITRFIQILEIKSHYTKNEDLVHGLESGADNYLSRPIDSNVLLALIKSMLRIQSTESKLRIALKEAETANELKSQFLANISHELRTPVTVILSALQMSNIILEDIEVQEIKQKLHKYNGAMKQNSYRLIRLINNLIDSSRIDYGFINMNRNNVNIVKLIEDITLSVAGFVESKQIELIFDTDVEERITSCDQDKIQTILFNLLSNAIKFTHNKGRITVNLFDHDDYIIISVQDTGIGISEEHKQKIFEKFIQVDDTLFRSNEGSGIGLSIAKSFVEMHGGEISLDSIYGQGSNFIVKLPIIFIEESDIERKIGQGINFDYIERMNIELSDIYV